MERNRGVVHMPAQLYRLRTKADRLRSDTAAQLRQLVLEYPGLPERARGEIIGTIDRQTASEAGWTFIMLSPEQNAAVVRWLRQHSERPVLALALWGELFTALRRDTGEIVLTREELAERVSARPNHVSGVWLIPLAPDDQHLVGGGLEGEAEAEQSVERGVRGAPAVEPEHELVEVGLEVRRPQPVVDAQSPPPRVREHAVDPGQHRVRRRVADHRRLVLDVLEARVAGPAVAHHRAALGHVAGDEGAERDGRVVADHREPGSSRPLAPDLDRTGDEQLALVRAPRPGRLAPARKGQAGLVDLDQAGQGLALRVDHRPPQLAEQQPGRLVAAQLELPPQLAGRHPVLVRRREPGRQEPGAQGQMAAVQRRAGGDRDLALARRALQGHPRPRQLPCLGVAAGLAAEPVGPPLLEQPAGAGRLVGEPGLELRQRSRHLGHPVPLPRARAQSVAWQEPEG